MTRENNARISTLCKYSNWFFFFRYFAVHGNSGKSESCMKYTLFTSCTVDGQNSIIQTSDRCENVYFQYSPFVWVEEKCIFVCRQGNHRSIKVHTYIAWIVKLAYLKIFCYSTYYRRLSLKNESIFRLTLIFDLCKKKWKYAYWKRSFN